MVHSLPMKRYANNCCTVFSLCVVQARLEVEAEETLDHVRLARLENRLLQAKIDIFDP